MNLDTLETKLQTDIAVFVQANNNLEKELKCLLQNHGAIEDLCNLLTIKKNQLDPKDYENLCIQDLKITSQIQKLQLIQTDYIKHLLLLLDIVRLDESCIIKDFERCQVTITETYKIHQDYQEAINSISNRIISSKPFLVN